MLSLPFLLLLLLEIAVALLVVFIRGNDLIRAAVLAVVIAALPWTLGSAVTSSCNDPALVARLAPIYVGAVALLGPAVMMVMLALTGRLERHRPLLVVATTLAGASCVVCWTTDLVVAGVWETPWGLLYPRAGPLNDLHLANFAVWASLGGVLVWRDRRRVRGERRRLHVRRLGWILALIALCATDGLLARGIGVYPFSVVPACVAAAVAIFGITRHDLLHSRGFDRFGAYELGLLGVLGVALFVVLWLALARAGLRDPELVALILTPLFGIWQLVIMGIRRRSRGEGAVVAREAERAVEEFVDLASRARAERELFAELSTLLASHARLSNVRLLVADSEGRCREVTAERGGRAAPAPTDVSVDSRARAWLIANRSPLAMDDLATARLGGLREPVEKLMSRIGAEVLVPLVDRERLVGLITTAAPPGGRALRDDERTMLREAARASAQALTYVALLREAEARVDLAKEVEVAAAVQHARAAGEQRFRFAETELVSFYQPAAQFGGHWWSSHELPDGRFLVVLGDVVGQGVSAALVSFTAEGACDTAQRMCGASVEVISLLEILNASVRGVGAGQYAMSCCAAIFDTDAGLVTFANAGHPFPYLCRRSDSGESDGRDRLRALVSRGTPLGGSEFVVSATTMTLAPDDVVVFFSDSLVDQTNSAGEPYGDRRLQKLLRNKVRAAGSNACQVILRDAMSHYGDREVDDDINVIVVRLGATGRAARLGATG